MKELQAKERAIEILRDGPTDEYQKILRYIYMLNIVYPNSHIRMHKSVNNEFIYLFIVMFNDKDFKFWKPLIVVDGAHLSGPYKEIFLFMSTLYGAFIRVVIVIITCL